ncbi:MAG: urease accessory protein UreE [Rhodomicrobium sp.]|nr:urease accessory protein UreE [Rhodomicrobium sp.]
MLRAVSVISNAGGEAAIDLVVLHSGDRHLRRKLLTTQGGEHVLVDLAEPVQLSHGDRLVLEDGRTVEVIAAEEELMEVTPRDTLHLVELAWHLGNRHLPAQIETARILIGRDHVIREMLIGLGASVRDVREPFQPVRGAYHSHGGGHSHAHSHSHHHTHDHED